MYINGSCGRTVILVILSIMCTGLPVGVGQEPWSDQCGMDHDLLNSSSMQEPALVSSIFTVRESMIEIGIMIQEEHTEDIYGFEISAENESSFWKNVSLVSLPQGWKWWKMGRGIRLFSTTAIEAGEPLTVKLTPAPNTIPDFLILSALDNNLIAREHVFSRYVEYPTPRKGFRLVGYSHTKNCAVIDYWGKFQIGKGGYKDTSSDMMYQKETLSIARIWTFLYEPDIPPEEAYECKSIPTQEGFRLVGYIHVKNAVIVETWGTLIPSSGGYVYVDATPMERDGQIESSIMVYIYDPVNTEEREGYKMGYKGLSSCPPPEAGYTYCCPPAPRGYELVGCCYVRNFQLVGSWGEEEDEDTLIHIHSVTIVENFQLVLDEIWGCFYKPISNYARKDPITGVYSTFALVGVDTVELFVRVVKTEYSGKIYDIEIFFAIQEPIWDGIEVLKVPDGWSYQLIDGGIRFYTETRPLIKCQPVTMQVKVQSAGIPQYIRLHLTDAGHENMGEIISTGQALFS